MYFYRTSEFWTKLHIHYVGVVLFANRRNKRTLNLEWRSETKCSERLLQVFLMPWMEYFSWIRPAGNVCEFYVEKNMLVNITSLGSLGQRLKNRGHIRTDLIKPNFMLLLHCAKPPTRLGNVARIQNPWRNSMQNSEFDAFCWARKQVQTTKSYD